MSVIERNKVNEQIIVKLEEKIDILENMVYILQKQVKLQDVELKNINDERLERSIDGKS